MPTTRPLPFLPSHHHIPPSHHICPLPINARSTLSIRTCNTEDLVASKFADVETTIGIGANQPPSLPVILSLFSA